MCRHIFFFFFQAEDGIRDVAVTGVQTCALPIWLNYAEHVTEMAKKRGEEPNIPPNADVGYRANNALVAHNENIVIPRDAGELVQYEGELVAVIGKQVKHISEADALSCVLGWTIGNDMSERTWQRGDRTLWR